MTVDLEFAIKQDIRNNPVVREVDADQKRDFLRALGWTALVLAMFFVALVPRFRSVSTGYRVQDLRDELAREAVYARQYRLELEQLRRPQILEDRARRELGMTLPGALDTLVLDRVPAGPPPDRAIVAAAR